MRLIDADVLREIVDFHVTSVSVCATVQQAIGQSDFKQRCLEDIDNAPTVDDVPVIHARPIWINPLDPEAKIVAWKCSSLCSACGDYVATSWKYCPNCGAKMDGGGPNDAD